MPTLGLTVPPPTQSATAPPTGFGDQDWNMGPTTTTKDWGADDGEWGNTEPVSVTVYSSLSLFIK